MKRDWNGGLGGEGRGEVTDEEIIRMYNLQGRLAAAVVASAS